MVGQLARSLNLSYFPFGKRKEMSKVIRKTMSEEGVIKISHYYMNEIIRLCLYTIKQTETSNLQNIRSQKILKRIEKYLIQTAKNKEFFENYKNEQETGVLPI